MSANSLEDAALEGLEFRRLCGSAALRAVRLRLTVRDYSKRGYASDLSCEGIAFKEGMSLSVRHSLTARKAAKAATTESITKNGTVPSNGFG